jgi:hypothetical protein
LLVTDLWQRGKGHILTVRNFFGVHQVIETNPSYSAGLEFELTGVAQSVELA